MPKWSNSLISAWNALKHDRAYGPTGIPGRIFYSSITAYVTDLRLGSEERETFIQYLLAMDEEFLNYVSEKFDKDTPSR